MSRSARIMQMTHVFCCVNSPSFDHQCLFDHGCTTNNETDELGLISFKIDTKMMMPGCIHPRIEQLSCSRKFPGLVKGFVLRPWLTKMNPDPSMLHVGRGKRNAAPNLMHEQMRCKSVACTNMHFSRGVTSCAAAWQKESRRFLCLR